MDESRPLRVIARQIPGTTRFTLVVVGEEKVKKRKTKREKRRIRNMHRRQRDIKPRDDDDEPSVRPSPSMHQSGSFRK